MLKKFAVTNYKNFKDRLEMDFGAVRNYAFNENCVRDGLLNKVILLGKNGTGKSNLGLAIFDIVGTLTENVLHFKQTDQASYLNGYSDKKFAVFEYEFKEGDRIISYTYKKADFRTITFEELKVDGKRLFMREDDNGDYEGLRTIGADRLRTDLRNGHLSVLRYIYANTLQKPDSPVTKVMDFVNRMLYFRYDTECNGSIGYGRTGELVYDYIINNGLVQDFQAKLKEIADMDVKLEVVKAPGTNGVVVQTFGKRKKLAFESIASTGTKVFALFYYWYKHLNDVSFVYMDEFDAYYHYKTAEKIVRLVNAMECQTVFTTQNISLLKNDLMRPDCYLVLDGGKVKSFSDSTGRELRRGHNIEKMYRNGEFDE